MIKYYYKKMNAVGIDVGGTSVKIGVVNHKGEVIARTSFKINPKEPGLIALKRIANIIKKFKKKYPLKGIGVGMPGVLDLSRGMHLYSSTTLNSWCNINIVDTLAKLTNLKVALNNDANAATLAEARFGRYKHAESIILLTLGTGVGGGIVVNNKLIVGNKGQGAELGHISINMHGRKCGCGRRGCLEAYASATALVKDTIKRLKKYPNSILNQKELSGKAIWDAYKKGDPLAAKVIEDYIHYLGEGILNYCVIFRPDVMLLSGGIANAGDLLLAPLRKYLRDNNEGIKGTAPVMLDLATLKYDSGIIGAASLVL